MKYLLLLVFLFSLTSTKAQTPPEGVDSTLFAYYRWCSQHRTDSLVLLKTDTMFRIAVEKENVRMQCVAMSLKADFYYFTNNLDSLKVWLPRVQNFARKKEQPDYYYFVWTRLILLYTKNAQYTLAQYELERFLKEAEKDNYNAGIADGNMQLAHIFRTKGLSRVAIEYYRKTIDFVKEHELTRFSLANLYLALADVYLKLEMYSEASTALTEGLQVATSPSDIWLLKLDEVIVYARTGDLTRARVMFDEIQKSHNGFIVPSRLLTAESAIATGANEYEKRIDLTHKVEEAFKKEGANENYYMEILLNRADAQAALGRYEGAYKSLTQYLKIYSEKVVDENESSLQEFATLLDVSRLDQERAKYLQEAQAQRLRQNKLLIITLCILLLAGVIVLALQLRAKRLLARAKFAAEESDRMKTELIRNVTHEINTPLNAIVGFAEMAASYAENDEERLSFIDIIRTNSSQLQKLIDNMLYMSDITASANSLSAIQVDLNACCRDAIEQTAEMRREGVAFEFHPATEEVCIISSQLYVTKIIKELLSNALIFTKQGTVKLEYTIDRKNNLLQLTITDTGCGVPKKESERIFERFVKLDTFTVGLGLGLSVCQMGAKALGGSVQLDTTYTSGARFLLSLPLTR